MKVPLYDESQEAIITIDMGNYRIVMQGELEPPTVDRKIGENFLSYERSFYGFNDPCVFSSSWVNLKLKTSKSAQIEQVRWQIPIAKKAWIEND